VEATVPNRRAGSRVNSDHLYVHVPFCRLVCAYCDFVTVAGRREAIPRYVEALLAELTSRPVHGELQTIYFGGGTPSLLPAGDIGRIVQAAMDRWDGQPAEVTLEANPSDRERPDWRALGAVGVNRISLGVQSLADADLVTLARGHTADEARGAFRDARAAGFQNVSIDLIYGIPGQTRASWRGVLDEAIALGPDHLSLYALSLALAPDEWAAPPRAGALRWRRRLASRQDDYLSSAQYQLAEAVLDRAGYRHYELSSWARPGFESRHNQAYWARRPYVGIGAGAHSYDGSAVRSWNTRDLDGYLAAVSDGRSPRAGAEHLDTPTQRFEAIALGLRRVAGLERLAFACEFGEDPMEAFSGALADQIRAGLIEVDPGAIRLTPRGRLLANEVLLALLPEAREAALTSV
jgi:oxygen-independent coproporphyrinogen III oxidase